MRKVWSFYIAILVAGLCRSRDLTFVHGNDDKAYYCRICPDHVMCLYQYDNCLQKCNDLENDDLESLEIESILKHHNELRNRIAQGVEVRGNPGPQPPARNMLELAWDYELAGIARRWALQCEPTQKDQCRDVERFQVWQNVHVLDLDAVEESTPLVRITSHIQSWYDEVDQFDSSEVGLVDYNSPNCSSYVAFATATINYVGCARATYTVNLSEFELEPTSATLNKTGNRVEVLVCNYGPIDRKVPRHLYEFDGIPGVCPDGTLPSTDYEWLCARDPEADYIKKKKQQRLVHGKREDSKKMNNVGFTTVSLHLMGLTVILSVHGFM
ncbi:venom allergen 5 [Cephus cinctus]|uniref:Venom allergen 5 n=1 Tax=Cephus cinctus TaxID=211228 RepID=A0AAJ7C4T5_CEPCN|nr:venom allergen 5 [Cephus cinctus]